MNSQSRYFNVEFDGTKFVFTALTLQDVITFCQHARLTMPSPLNWVISELDNASNDVGRQSVINAIGLALRHSSDTKRLVTEDRYLWTRDGLRLLFDLSLAKSEPGVKGEEILSLATDQQVLDIATRILQVTRIALEERKC